MSRLVAGEPKVRLNKAPDLLIIEDGGWLTLGHLRALVQDADDRGWSDKSLVSHGGGGTHPSRCDVKPAYKVVIEGRDPE
jgi:hypothetical protein